MIPRIVPSRRFIPTRTRANQFVRLAAVVNGFLERPSAAGSAHVAHVLELLRTQDRRDVRRGHPDMLHVDGFDPLFGMPVAAVLDEAERIVASGAQKEAA